MSDLFAGTWALVTGASSGLGEEFARQLAARGAKLVLTARRGELLAALAASLAKQHGTDTRVVAHDLAAPGAAAGLCAKVDALGLEIDHLVNNAGFGLVGRFLDGDAVRMAEMVRLNCEALSVLSHHFLARMAARRRGGVLHVASLAGLQPVPFMASYSATKAYVLSLSVALAEELRPTGVRVSALCPGPVATGFQAAAGTGAISGAMRPSVLSAADTVRRGLDAYAEGRDVCIPGAVNKVTALGAKLLPRTLVARAAGNMMRRKGRDD